jgi:hypothetical protein
MKFYELAVGARFVFRGRRFEKIAMSVAHDEQRCGTVFMGETEVSPDGVPLLLPAAEAARWKRDDTHWTKHLAPAPREPWSKAPAASRRDTDPTSSSSG